MMPTNEQNIKRDRVFVSGSNGFVGKALCRVLVAKGYSVVDYNLSEGKDILDLKEVKKNMKGCDYVFHLAALLDEKAKNLNLVNVQGTKNLLEAAAEQQLKKFVFLSTTGVLGDFEGCSDESFPYNPKTPYEESKAEAEKLVLSYQEVLPVVIIRSALVLGANSYWEQIIRLIGKNFPIIGNGKNTFQLVYVKNLASALLAVIERGQLGETYIVVDSEEVDLNTLYEMFSKELGFNEKPRHVPKIVAKLFAPLLDKKILTSEHIDRLCRNRCYDNSKLKALGWSQIYSLRAAIKETVSSIAND